MAMNTLLHRHQLSLMRVRAATSREARSAHREAAGVYAEQIRALRASFGGLAVSAGRVS
jgi:hypothetical protein